MPGGRPTKYKEEYCQKLIKFFNIAPHFETPCITTLKNGTTKEEIKFIPSDLPLLSTFAVSIGVCRDTVYEWANGKDKDGKLRHPEFSDALKVAKDCQRRILITNGLKGLYNNTFAIFTAKNLIAWRDKTEVDQKVDGAIKVKIMDYGTKVKDAKN